jgi:AbrB family looped-hinge helix DNA binding protein
MNAIATLSSKFQISIPKSIRDAEGWEAGQKFVFVPNGGSIVLTPVPRRDALTGIAKGADPTGYRDRNDRY